MNLRKVITAGLVCLYLFPAFVQAGTVTGKALFSGEAPPNQKIDMAADPVCSGMHKTDFLNERVVVNSNQTLKNVFVYVKEGLGGQAFPAPQTPAVLDQEGCWYYPHVQGMQAGQKLQILNSDATLHNVHAVAKNNAEFNLGMPLQGMKLEKTFSNPEIMIKMKCDVHPWMNGYIGVVSHPFYAVTGDDGSFEIKDLPPGEYTIEAWHEVYGTQTQKIAVPGGSVNADFQFSSSEIVDEASGLKITAEAPKPINRFDDSAALNKPRAKTGWWLPENISTYGGKLDRLFYVILWITSIVFIAVQVALLIFLFKYRDRPGAKAAYTHGNNRLEIIWTVIPALILVFLTIASQKLWSEIKGQPPAGAIPIEIQAEQFAWNVRYTGKDGKFGTSDDIKTINQLHIPVGKPVRVRLTSIAKDNKHPVIHSFFLPEVRLKQDVVPGMAIDVWFEATRTGQYEIACAEFCGLGHYRMRGFLSIHSQEGFDAWLREAAQGGIG
ncbi:MAG: cytochrome c oxidase subunit II [Candidatus Omnitrophica bacterium CG11_big_fil_rev_8_21_14_0_20_45_26]|uniref:Cytochrome c oxidase subunit 2 n=1 Tax=Candidatus Abzuiibacterium crystallinum TaxID=1974748 RepID=A0A2H0LRH5_9BACT|nr:MAG: cytochrome c oxidase subunit II [Candidatus Omnitrophica bacterium CG11_big_fil_rev_8_21_14_0_20_45_26]PIW65712.1 MAG: cytochrome c oxidase subunit II [Candidatus Omnitrophica bacterium CG12_big_fil_rev_8_21_14_0_65_45_16]